MKYRRLLSFVLAMLMVVSLLPISALAAGGKNTKENVAQTATIGGKSVKVQLKGVPSGTKLKLAGAKKSAYYNAVDSVVEGDFDVVLALNVRVNPALKKAVSAKLVRTCSAGSSAPLPVALAAIGADSTSSATIANSTTASSSENSTSNEPLLCTRTPSTIVLAPSLRLPRTLIILPKP